MASSTWTWLGITNITNASTNWALTGGPGNAGGYPQAGDTAIIPGGTIQTPLLTDASLNANTLDLTGSGGVIFANNTTIASSASINATSVINATGTADTLTLQGPLTNSGTIEVTGTATSLAISITAGSVAAGELLNGGQIIVGQGDRLTITGGTLADAGAVTVNGGTAVISSVLTGLDNFAVGTGGSLELTQAGTRRRSTAVSTASCWGTRSTSARSTSPRWCSTARTTSP